MRIINSLVTVLVLLAVVCGLTGCSPKAKEPIPTANPAPSVSVSDTTPVPATSEPASTTEKAPLITLQALEQQGLKLTRNADNSIKAVDFTNAKIANLAKKEAVDPDVFKSLSTARVVRGKGELSPGTLLLLSDMPRLTELLWTETEMAAAPFGELASLKELKKVRLAGLKTDSMKTVFKILASFPVLVDLDISGSCITDSDLTAGITPDSFAKLTRLNLYSTAVGNNTVAALAPLAGRLEWLNLDATAVTDDAGASLEKFQKLSFLHLGRTKITNKIATNLVKLTQLKSLHVTRTGMDAQGFDVLKKALPNAEIVTVPPADK